MGQGGVILTDYSEAEREVGEIEQLNDVEETADEEEFRNEDETGYERFPLAC